MKKNTLRVKETGEFGRYLVESHSKPNNPYLVDLTERDGHGVCNCTYFQTTANQNYKRHGKFIPYRTDENGKVNKGVSECKHLAAVRNHYHMHVTMPMLASMKKGVK